MQLPFKLPTSALADHPGLHFLARVSVKTRLAAAFGFVVAVLLLTLWLLLQSRLDQVARMQSEEAGTLLVSQSAEAITELVLTNDLLSLNVVLNQLVSAPSVRYAAVYNVDQQLIAEAGDRSTQEGAEALRFTAPIDLQDSIAGVLELSVQNTAWQQQRSALGLLFLGVTVAGLVFVMVMALALSSHLLGPLGRLRRAFDNPLDAPPLPDSLRGDEIRETEEAAMQVLEDYQELLRLEAWRNEAGNAWRKRHADISVLSVSVVNFESSLSILNPSTMTRLLNTYYRLLEQVAELYQGQFFRFTGDSVLLAFDRQQCASPEFNAVCCGALFQHLVKRQNVRQVAQASPVLEFRALVHSGPALVARTGLQDTSALALLGETIDTALEMTGDCPPGALALSDEARREAVEEYSLAFRPVSHEEELALQVVTTPLERITPLLTEQAEAILPDEEPGEAGEN